MTDRVRSRQTRQSEIKDAKCWARESLLWFASINTGSLRALQIKMKAAAVCLAVNRNEFPSISALFSEHFLKLFILRRRKIPMLILPRLLLGILILDPTDAENSSYQHTRENKSRTFA